MVLQTRPTIRTVDEFIMYAQQPENADLNLEFINGNVASGLIVGESLWGVLNAGLIVGLNTDAPIGLVPESFAPAPWLGVLGFVAMIVWLYGWMLKRASASTSLS